MNFQDELTAIYDKMEPISYYGMPEHIVALKWDISRFQAILLTVAVSKEYGKLNGASGDPKLTGLTYLAEELGLSIDTVSEQADLLDQAVISYIVEQIDITIATYFK